MAQNRIKRTLLKPESIEYIRNCLTQGSYESINSLAVDACAHFGFIDARGRPQTANCTKALLLLERKKQFSLPRKRCYHTEQKGRNVRRLTEPVPKAVGVPDSVDLIQGLILVQAKSDDEIRTVNELMHEDHPLGASFFVGAQMRYLVGSEHGWLGALIFTASTVQLSDCDRWIGWETETRLSHFNQVVSLSRFLIRKSVLCKNLATHVLTMVVQRLRADYLERYEYEPLLIESFIDTDQLDASFKAANWIAVGHTKGQKYQDKGPNSIKRAIYVYPLVPNFRELLGISTPEDFKSVKISPLELDALQPGQGLDDQHFARQEFGDANLGHAVLNERLVTVAACLARSPGCSINRATMGDRAAAKGAYRLIEKPDASAITVEAILAPHQLRTLQRMKSEKIVLAILDGSSNNHNSLKHCRGLGVISTNKAGVHSAGLYMHTVLTVSTSGIPLGLLDVNLYAPTLHNKDEKSIKIPIDERKTVNWLRGTSLCEIAAQQLPQTQIVCLMDREADIWALFHQTLSRNYVDLVVRAKRRRLISDELTLFEYVRSSDFKGELEIVVPRKSHQTTQRKQKDGMRCEFREARVEVRFCSVSLPPPSEHQGKAALNLNAIHVLEIDSPQGVEPLEWLLLTTREVTTLEQAMEIVGWYRQRWKIEDYHRVLKSGCKIEELQYESAERLKRVVAINAVIAWRIMVMTLLGRQVPGLNANLLFTDREIKILRAVLGEKKSDAKPMTLGRAILGVAKLGGYLGRNKEPPPGHQTMWTGYYLLRMGCFFIELWEKIYMNSD
jgi:hypothetical protein